MSFIIVYYTTDIHYVIITGCVWLLKCMFVPVVAVSGTTRLALEQTIAAIFPSSLNCEFRNFAMKRGAESQLTKEAIEEGYVEPEARLPNTDDQPTHSSFSITIANVGNRFQKSFRANFERQSVRNQLSRRDFPDF